MKIDVLKGTLLKTNNYLLSNENNAILIEASCSLQSLEKALGAKKLSAILLTHGHWDHYLNLEQIAKKFCCPVYMSFQALEKINAKEKAFNFDRNPQVDVSKIDVKFLEDGQTLDFGAIKLLAISTPGHTNCSFSFLLEQKNILFSGDVVFENAVGRTDLPTSNFLQLCQSLTKLLKLKPETKIYPGHGNTTTLGAEKQQLENMIFMAGQ